MISAEIGHSDKYRGVECIIVATEFRHKELIRQVAGARYDADMHRWVTPLTWTACVALRGVFGAELSVGPQLQAWSWNDYNLRILPALTARGETSLADDDASPFAQHIRSWRALEEVPLPDGSGFYTLYPFQETGVKFLATARHCLLTDEMGTGKTGQVVRTLRLLYESGIDPFPVLIICPNTVKHTWCNEFKKFWPAVTPTVLTGGGAARDKQIDAEDGVVIMNWESVRLHSRLSAYGDIKIKRCHVCDPSLSPEDKINSQTRCEHCPKALNKKAWTTVVIDESHRSKDPRAKQTRAVWACVTPETENCFALTGTPIANNPLDLWASLRFIDGRSWPSKVKYQDRYCETVYNPFGGFTVTGLKAENKDEFFKAVDPQMRRMPKEIVLPFLPKKTYIERYVSMSPKQAKAYKQMVEQLAAQLEGGVVVASNPLVQLTRLVQFASSYATVDEQGQVRLEDPSCKVDALVELLDDLVEEPLVVFAMSRQLIDLASHRLTKLGVSHGLITGGQSAAERQINIDNFQSGRTRVIMGTLAAGGVGITLTRSRNLAFLQRSWSLVENNQAEDRVHRIGAEVHDKINIFDIIAEDTLESRIREVVAGKWDRLEEFVRDRAFIARILEKGK